jgi:TetR/AcrR family transcriptional regulator, transcriptional repressor for nem operon
LIAESLDHGVHGTLGSLDEVPGTSAGRAKYVKSYLSTRHRDELGTGCVISGLAADVRQEPKARGPFTRLLKAFVGKIASRFPWQSKNAARGLLRAAFRRNIVTFLAHTGYREQEIKTVKDGKSEYPG